MAKIANVMSTSESAFRIFADFGLLVFSFLITTGATGSTGSGPGSDSNSTAGSISVFLLAISSSFSGSIENFSGSIGTSI